MPGMEARAPERTETRSGLAASPKALPVSSSTTASAAAACCFSSAGYCCELA